MVYRGGPFADWPAVTAAIHARTVEMVTVANADEEMASRAEGFGDVDSIMAKPKKAKG